MGGKRQIAKVLRSKPTVEGAGVRLKRAFGYYEIPLLDPFLLLDDFHSSDPNDYVAGFPWHPHRGIETVTYMLHGEVEHGDSLDNRGAIGPGDAQWMTSGSGIIHQEMPKRQEGVLRGFQLWVNLPASHKMMAPRYQGIKSKQVPVVEPAPGVTARVLCGELDGVRGPVRDIIADPKYIDVAIAPNRSFAPAVKPGHKVFAYIIEGTGFFAPEETEPIGMEHLIVFGDGDSLDMRAGDAGVRFLLVSGKPINEPVAWRGPIVMNTQAELMAAFQEYENDTFIKDKA